MALFIISGIIGGIAAWYSAEAMDKAWHEQDKYSPLPPAPTTTLTVHPAKGGPGPDGVWTLMMPSHKPYPYEKREPDDDLRPAVFGLDTANLRGKDLERLKGIKVNIHSPDNVVVVGHDFSVQGSVALERENSLSGYLQGNISFHVPGLEAPAEGSFILVNETAAGKKTIEDFQKVVAGLQEDRPEPELIEAYSKARNDDVRLAIGLVFSSLDDMQS